ncbi:hypothetical protein BH09PSE6_BH09PSE6_13690 [soil metagenome]
MNDYILLMHDDVPVEHRPASETGWDDYIAGLAATGQFLGGSSIGPGVCHRITAKPAADESKLSGFVRVVAESVEDARKFLSGNPVYEAGGTVEIRLLPRD